MLEVGCKHGPGGDSDPGLSFAEARTHFGGLIWWQDIQWIFLDYIIDCIRIYCTFRNNFLIFFCPVYLGHIAWCIVSSPLILSHDTTNATVTDEIWPIISNTEAIAVNQAWAGDSGTFARSMIVSVSIYFMFFSSFFFFRKSVCWIRRKSYSEVCSSSYFFKWKKNRRCGYDSRCCMAAMVQETEWKLCRRSSNEQRIGDSVYHSYFQQSAHICIKRWIGLNESQRYLEPCWFRHSAVIRHSWSWKSRLGVFGAYTSLGFN